MTEFEGLCRHRGLPLTIQRRTILEEIADRGDHPTAEQIFNAVQERIPGVSRTTVYRGLSMLVELGIIQKIYDPGGAARFDPSTHQHHHFACRKCHRVIDLEEERFPPIALPAIRDQGFEITESHIFFRGTCPACRAKPGDPRTAVAAPEQTKRGTKTTSARRRGAKP